jgi:hypothetical protein
MESMLGLCSSMHLIFEGTGFSQTVQRMAMVSIMMLSGRRGKVFISSSLKEAIEQAPADDQKELAQALRQALDEGFLSKTKQRVA